MPAFARLAGKRVRSSECLLNNETVSSYLGDIDPGTIQAVVSEHLPALESAMNRMLSRSR